MLCNLTLNQKCAVNFISTRVGQPKAIVFVDLGMTIEAYDTLAIKKFQRWYPTAHPKSVHFSIDSNGNISQYLDVNSVAFGIDSLQNPTYPGIIPSAEINNDFIFIGIENYSCLDSNSTSAVKLTCCLLELFNLPATVLTIITAKDLNDSLNPSSLPSSFLGLVQSCLLSHGSNPPDPVFLSNEIELLKICCQANTAVVTNLTNRVNSLESTVATLSSNSSQQAAQLATALAQISSFPGQLEDLQTQLQLALTTLASHQLCINTVCPAPSLFTPIHYQLTRPQFLTPGVEQIANFSQKISDTLPSSVQIGPLWSVTLQPGAQYTLSVSLKLDPAEYCIGRKVTMKLFLCGQFITLDEFTASSGATFSPTLSASIPFTAPASCGTLYVKIGTDDTATPSKTVSFGDILITRIS